MQGKKSSNRQFSIEIPNWTNENGVVHYNIHFQNTSTGISWGLKQRYSGLAQLHDEVIKFLKINKDIAIQLPQFPSKKWWLPQDSAFLTERKTLLQEYLQTLFSQSEITSVNPIADAFLQPNELITYNLDDCNVEGMTEQQQNNSRLEKDSFHLLNAQENRRQYRVDSQFKQETIIITQLQRQNLEKSDRGYVEEDIGTQNEKQLKLSESSNDYLVQHEQQLQCDPIFSPNAEAISAIKKIADEILPSFDSMNSSPGLKTYLNYCFPATSSPSSGLAQNNEERSNAVENDYLYQARYLGPSQSPLIKLQEQFNSAKIQFKKAVSSIHEEQQISSFIEPEIFQVENSMSSNYSRLARSNNQSQSFPSIIEQCPEEKEYEIEEKFENLSMQEKQV